MAYLHCHNCGWSQDDFWSEDNKGWSPFKPDRMAEYKKDLFREKIHMDLECLASLGAHLKVVKKDEKGWYISGQEYVALELERKARSIRNMFLRTYEDWEKVKNIIRCPRCDKGNWDID
jgi:hypothetical protein